MAIAQEDEEILVIGNFAEIIKKGVITYGHKKGASASV